MSRKRLLLLSNSMNYGQEFLEHAEGDIRDFLGDGVKRVLFVPFAGVTRTYDQYAAAVGEKFKEIGYELVPVHKAADAAEAIRSAEAVAVGGGNTFHLLRGLYESGLIESIRERVEAGLPYIGWSAGSNVACPTIRTTNDMPIVEPPSFNALNLVPFQINPHYT
ncbi:MAG TPA: dipeptidase PepE, partial [Pyrinomonadaceae bacterium]|nr:dipeptidase PepE [Pyrinomonadaceae bacterium]